MTILVPLGAPGRSFKWIFKFPILLDSIGLSMLIPGWMLLLITAGRNSGKRIITPVEYLYHKADGAYWVMSGWRGNTDWYKNVKAHPQLTIKVKGKYFTVGARPLTNDEVLEYLQEILTINPGAIAIFSRWAGKPILPSIDSLREVCCDFPGYALIPVKA